MARSKHAPDRVAATLRQRQAAELRAQKLTQEEIAERLGVSRQRVGQLLDAWDTSFRSENADRAEEIRTAQLDEIRLLKHAWFPRATSKDASSKDLTAYAKLLDHEANLAGAKAPARTATELSGPGGGPVQTVAAAVDLSTWTPEQLAAAEQLSKLLPS